MNAIGMGPTLALRLRRVARAAFDLTGPTLPVGATLKRASPALRTNNSGLLVTEGVNAARFDYNAVTLTPAGLLYEAQATNLCLYSDNFGNANGWIGAAVTADATVAPDGTTTADLIVSSAASGSVSRRISNPGTAIVPGPIAVSVFLKRSNCDWHRFVVGDAPGNNLVNNGVQVWVNLATGMIGSTSSIGTGWTPIVATVGPAGNGFVRVAISVYADATTAVLFMKSASADASTTSADIGSGAGIGSAWYAWGAQIEAGGLTSYIPTTTAVASRSADILTLNWASVGVADGPVTARHIFDDQSTQDVAMTISGGLGTVPTTLDRRRIVRVAII